MSNDITIDARLDTFFDASVDNLKDDHYVEHGSVCDICRADDMADPPEIIEHASSITRTGVVQTMTCPLPHIFHKLCLYAWMHAKLRRNANATCPMCRTTLIVCSPGPWRESFLEEPESLARQLGELYEMLAIFREQNEAEMNEARAALNRFRAGRDETE